MHNLAQSENPFHLQRFSYGYRPSNKTPAILHNPGVGDYNIQDNSPTSPIIKFAQGKRRDPIREKLYIPGPGAYNLITPVETDLKKYSSSPMSKLLNQKGGHLRNSQSQSFQNEALSQSKEGSRSPKREQQKPSPGPGAYNIQEAEALMHKKIGGAFTTAGRKPDVNLEGMSGEAYYSYNLNDSIGHEGPQHSFTKGAKLPEIKNDVPGPTKYEVQNRIAKRTIPKVSFSKSSKVIKTHMATVLGPGQYEVNGTSFEKGVSLSKSRRPPNLNGEVWMPGPGSYEIEDEFTKKSRLLAKQNKLKKLLANAKSLSPEAGTAEITSANLSKMMSEDLDGSDRQNRLPNIPLESKGFKSTWVDTMLYNDSSPGPIYYVNNETLEASKKGTKFQMEVRPPINADEIKRNVPGPGNYEDFLHKSGEFSFLKSPKPDMISQERAKLPGPGRYENLPKEHLSGGAIGKAYRRIAKYDNQFA